MQKTYIIHQDLDSWYVNKNLQYLLWFDPTLGTIIFDDEKIVLVFDWRYFWKIQKIKKILFKKFFWKEIEVINILLDSELSEKIEKYIKWENIVLEKNIPTYFYKNIKKLNPEKIDFVNNLFENERIIKTRNELLKIRKAIKIIEKVYKKIYSEKESLIWKKELEVRNIIQRLILEYWWDWESFAPVIAFGKNSAIPHHQTWNTRIWNWPLLIDMWAVFKWYCSDFTRTFWVWERTKIYDEFVKVRNIVKGAHDLGVKFVKENNLIDSYLHRNDEKSAITWKDLDKIVREAIEKSWYWKYFIHSTGHWVWLQIHELPWISAKKTEIKSGLGKSPDFKTNKLEKWMVFTIEPGIYLPGRFWVRLENIVIM